MSSMKAAAASLKLLRGASRLEVEIKALNYVQKGKMTVTVHADDLKLLDQAYSGDLQLMESFSKLAVVTATGETAAKVMATGESIARSGLRKTFDNIIDSFRFKTETDKEEAIRREKQMYMMLSEIHEEVVVKKMPPSSPAPAPPSPPVPTPPPPPPPAVVVPKSDKNGTVAKNGPKNGPATDADEPGFNVPDFFDF